MARIVKYFFLISLMMVQCVYGNEFERFVHDRPQVIQVMMPDDTVWVWLDEKFKDTLGQPVYWNPYWELNDPRLNNSSGYSYEYKGKYYIKVIKNDKDGVPVSGERVLQSVVFELFNASHRYEFAKLNTLVVDNRISCDDYIKQAASIEFKTFQDVAHFYSDVLLNNSSLETKRFSYHKEIWVVTYPDFDRYWNYQVLVNKNYIEGLKTNYINIKKEKHLYSLDPIETPGKVSQ